MQKQKQTTSGNQLRSPLTYEGRSLLPPWPSISLLALIWSPPKSYVPIPSLSLSLNLFISVCHLPDCKKFSKLAEILFSFRSLCSVPTCPILFTCALSPAAFLSPFSPLRSFSAVQFFFLFFLLSSISFSEDLECLHCHSNDCHKMLSKFREDIVLSF